MENREELLKQLEVGRTYVIRLSSGALISGALASRYECLTEEGIQKSYRIAFGNSKFIDIAEEEIETIELVEHRKTVLEYLEKFGKEHMIHCFDDTGNILSNSVILGKIIEKEIWDDLLEQEKRELLSYLRLSSSDVVEILNVYMDSKSENAKMHEKRLETLTATLRFLEKYNAMKEAFPHFNKAFEFLYKDSGVQELIDAVK